MLLQVAHDRKRNWGIRSEVTLQGACVEGTTTLTGTGNKTFEAKSDHGECTLFTLLRW